MASPAEMANVSELRNVRKIREARGQSRDFVVQAVNAMDPANPVTAPALRALEETTRIPDVLNLISRLDMVYGTDGRLGVDRWRESACPADIHFPDFWVGPVWIQTLGPTIGCVGMLELVWGPWRRRQLVRAGTVLTTRKATRTTPVLRANAPAGWVVITGMGAVPAALDINGGWYPRNLSAALSLLDANLRRVSAARADRTSHQR